MTALIVEDQNSGRVIIVANHGGKRWEIDVRADFDKDGGIIVEITRDGVICTEAGFDWSEQHINEQQD